MKKHRTQALFFNLIGYYTALLSFMSVVFKHCCDLCGTKPNTHDHATKHKNKKKESEKLQQHFFSS